MFDKVPCALLSQARFQLEICLVLDRLFLIFLDLSMNPFYEFDRYCEIICVFHHNIYTREY